jgi:hypothetical protein
MQKKISIVRSLNSIKNDDKEAVELIKKTEAICFRFFL